MYVSVCVCVLEGEFPVRFLPGRIDHRVVRDESESASSGSEGGKDKDAQALCNET